MVFFNADSNVDRVLSILKVFVLLHSLQQHPLKVVMKPLNKVNINFSQSVQSNYYNYHNYYNYPVMMGFSPPADPCQELIIPLKWTYGQQNAEITHQKHLKVYGN